MKILSRKWRESVLVRISDWSDQVIIGRNFRNHHKKKNLKSQRGAVTTANCVINWFSLCKCYKLELKVKKKCVCKWIKMEVTLCGAQCTVWERLNNFGPALSSGLFWYMDCPAWNLDLRRGVWRAQIQWQCCGEYFFTAYSPSCFSSSPRLGMRRISTFHFCKARRAARIKLLSLVCSEP